TAESLSFPVGFHLSEQVTLSSDGNNAVETEPLEQVERVLQVRARHLTHVGCSTVPDAHGCELNRAHVGSAHPGGRNSQKCSGHLGGREIVTHDTVPRSWLPTNRKSAVTMV